MKDRCTRLFYWPSECLVAKTSARCRRALAAWALLIATPALIAVVAWQPTALWIADGMLIVTTALSFYALVASETPVEPEASSDEGG